MPYYNYWALVLCRCFLSVPQLIFLTPGYVSLSLCCSWRDWSRQVKSLSCSLERRRELSNIFFNEKVPTPVFNNLTVAFALRGIHFLAAWCRTARSRGGEQPRPVLALLDFCCTVSLKDLATVLCLGHQLGLLTRWISGGLSSTHL